MGKENFFSKDSTKKLTKSLSEVLATTYILYVKTQNFHWNIEGQHFYFLHKMLEEQYDELAEAVDIIAERIPQLGMKAPGTMKEFIALSAIKESTKTLKAKEMIKELSSSHQILSNLLHKKIAEAQKLGDEGTADLYIQRLRSHDKTHWMLKSHLEKE